MRSIPRPAAWLTSTSRSTSLRGMISVTAPSDQDHGPTRCAPGDSQGADRRRVGRSQRRLRRGIAIRGGGCSEGRPPGQPMWTPASRYCSRPSPILRSPTKTVSQKFSSRPVRALAGLLIGLLLGTLVALARGLLDKRVNSAKRAQAALGYPVVAEIPAESSDSSEAYRMLWLSVFREPLPEAVEQGDQWLEGADLALDSGYLARVGTVRSAVHQPLPVPVARPDPRTARGPQRGDGHLPGFGTVPGPPLRSTWPPSAPRSDSGWWW